MCNENEGHACLVPKLLEQIHDLSLYGNIKSRGGFIGDQQIWFKCDGHGNHHPLTHPAGKLMGVVSGTSVCFGNAHPFQQIDGTAFCFRSFHLAMDSKHFSNLPSNGKYRIERCEGILKNHGDFFPRETLPLVSVHIPKIVSFKPYSSCFDHCRRAGQKLHHCHRGNGFPGTAFAHNGEGLTSTHRITDTVYGLDSFMAGSKFNA
jgi:hypothetical protein